ncbi:hypothetical protein GF377_00840 [candidate division GN15 bacterium]|nr:hypothetical protein [candidate division GN15 bacterium]
MSADSMGAAPWMRKVLKVAAVYNILWGTLVILFPAVWFDVVGMEPPRYLSLWQCIGMVVGVFGIGYAAAARNPLNHWPIVLVGFLGKLLGPIGFAFAVAQGELPLAFGWTVVTNDLIWLVPFAMILYSAARSAQDMPYGIPVGRDSLDLVLEEMVTARDNNLGELTDESPVLLVFLRHFGCIFCMETLKRLALQKAGIADKGVKLVLVHMSDEARGDKALVDFRLEDADHLADPDRRLYRLFGLERGSLRQLFGVKVWLRSFAAMIRTGRFAGKLEGDGFQMPGAVVLHKRQVITVFRHETAADQPDYLQLATCTVQPATEGTIQGS